MTAITPQLSHSVEVFRVRSRRDCLPGCQGLRIWAALTAPAQLAIVARPEDFGEYGPPVRVGFALCGFLLAGFLLRHRDRKAGIPWRDDSSGFRAWIKLSWHVISPHWLILGVAALWHLPDLLALRGMPASDLAGLSDDLRRIASSLVSRLGALSFDGASALAWPLIVLVTPRRALGLMTSMVLGAVAAIRLLSLFAAEVGPASILVELSAFDFLALGSLLALIFHRGQDAVHGRLGRWAALTGLAIALGTLIFRSHGELPDLGVVALLRAPAGFGLLNFIAQTLATVMVASLSWHDIGGLIDHHVRPRAS